jgi:ADP-heptose:LPS heptosyltransferase
MARAERLRHFPGATNSFAFFPLLLFKKPRMAPSSGTPAAKKTFFSRKARTLLWIDHFAGIPICFLLTALRRLGDLLAGGRADGAPRKILFLKLAEQGSTVLAHEALSKAVARVGRENVYFLVFEENRFIVDVLGLIPPENVLAVRSHSAWAMATSALGLLFEIRRKGIDTCVDMEFFTRVSSAIAALTGARRRVGFHTYFGEGPYRGDLFTHRVLYNPHLHTAVTFATLVSALDVDPRVLPTYDLVPSLPPPLPRFQPARDEVAGMQGLLAELGVAPGDRVLLLNANASDLLPLRKWNAQNYVSLARRALAEFPDARIGFTGTPEEAPAIEALVAAVGSPRAFCLAGRTTLRQLLVVYGLAEILVTNDSGPAHFAALTSVDVVALFGPETPLLFAAPSPRNHAVWAGIVCSPCVNVLNNRQTSCRDNVCMKRITVDEVFETVCRIYRQRAANPPQTGLS